MQAAARQAEASLRLAADIVERIMHEDIHENPQLIIGVMMAMAETHTAQTIREGFEGLVEQRKTERYH
jgi:hypothetical protein